MARRGSDQTRQQPQVPYGSYSSCGDKVYTLKFVLVGSRGVGKSHLASLFHKKQGGYPSVGMQFATRTLRYGERSSVRAQIWDTAGEFPFQSVTEAFFRGAVGAMLVYDISRRSTFDDLLQWLTLVRGNCHESVALTLVGNKSDMSSKQREVSMVEGMRFARRHGLDFLETSAAQAEHVEEACRQLVMSVARYLPQEKCVWSKQPSYPLPAGWVPIAPGDGKSSVPVDENANPEKFHPDTYVDEAGLADIAQRHSREISKRNSHDTDATVPNDMDTETEMDAVNTDIDSDCDSTYAVMMPPPPRPAATPSGRRLLGARRRVSESAAPQPCLVAAFDGSVDRRTPPAPSASASRACKIFGVDSSRYSGHRRHTRINSDSATASRNLSCGSSSTSPSSLPPPPAATTADTHPGADPELSRGSSGSSSGGDGRRRRNGFGSPGRVSWYENIWTGERVSHRPRSPAGPSEACVVSRVPRALGPPGPPGGSGGTAAKRGWAGKGSAMELVGKTPTWSFSSFTSRGYAAAAQCLSKCVDP